MTQYTDKNGKEIKLGHIIKYDQNDNCRYGKGIYEIIEHKNELVGVERVGYPYWTLRTTPYPIKLHSFCIKPNTIMVDSEIIGDVNQNPDMLTTEYAAILFQLAAE